MRSCGQILQILALCFTIGSTYSFSAQPSDEEKAEILFGYISSLLWDPVPKYRLAPGRGSFQEQVAVFLESLEVFRDALMKYPEYRWRAEFGYEQQNNLLRTEIGFVEQEARSASFRLDPLAETIASFDEFVKAHSGQSEVNEETAERLARDRTLKRPPDQLDIENWEYQKNLARARNEESFARSVGAGRADFEKWRSRALVQYAKNSERLLRHALQYFSTKPGTRFFLRDASDPDARETPVSAKAIDQMQYRKVLLYHSSSADDRERLWGLSPAGTSQLLGWKIPYLESSGERQFGMFDYNIVSLFDSKAIRRSLLANRLNHVLGYASSLEVYKEFDVVFSSLDWSKGPVPVRAALVDWQERQKNFSSGYFLDQTADLGLYSSSPVNLLHWLRAQGAAAIRRRVELLKSAPEVLAFPDVGYFWRELGHSDSALSRRRDFAVSGEVDRDQALISRSQMELEDNDPVYRVKGNTPGSSLPTYFEVFVPTPNARRVRKLPEAREGFSYSVAQRLVKPATPFLFPIPSELDHELVQLEVYGPGRTPLRRGKDFHLLWDPDTNTYAVFGGKSIEFQARFQKRLAEWDPSPTLAAALSQLNPQVIGELANRLKAFGFGEKAREMKALSKQKSPITLGQLEEALKIASVYSWREDENEMRPPKNRSRVDPLEEWIWDASRRLDLAGRFCVQCLQQNAFSNQVLSRVLKPANLKKLIVDLRRVLVRPEGEEYLSSHYGHARNYLYLEGSKKRPVISDTTPSLETNPTEATRAYLRRSAEGKSSPLESLGEIYQRILQYSDASLAQSEKRLYGNEPLALFLSWANQLLQTEVSDAAAPAIEMTKPRIDQLKEMFSGFTEKPKPILEHSRGVPSLLGKIRHRKYQDPEMQRLLKEGFEGLSDCVENFKELSSSR